VKSVKHISAVTKVARHQSDSEVVPQHFGSGLDRWAHSQLAQLTGGISPTSLRLAFEDWLTHLALSPDEQVQLTNEYLNLLSQVFAVPSKANALPTDLKGNIIDADKRFANSAWEIWPFNIISKSFLLNQHWWQLATTNVLGVSKHHQDVVQFILRQMVDMCSPANFICLNPEVLSLTAKTGGRNLMQGYENFLDRLNRIQNKLPPLGAEEFEVGKAVAVTPGKVIYRNQLIELIQYEPSTPKVHPEPILMVPAWIMKYYILDLSPSNSMVKYLVDQGHTVFMISWLNPGSQERDLGMDDYLNMGVMESIKAINIIVPDKKIHGVGYCLGGTLLAIAAAAMGGNKDDRLASITLFAAQTDFTEPGELSTFIDASQIAFLEDIMWEKGYLDSRRMNGAFQLLNSNDLLWSRILRNYLLGQSSPLNDLAAWNADGTRLPYRMHSEYLRTLFLNNDLAAGRYRVNQKPIALANIDCPIFCVATVRDHVAPWPSVYKLHLLTHVELTFLLSSGGHNVGIVNPPGVPDRSFQVQLHNPQEDCIDYEQWKKTAPYHEGSWWPYWLKWLNERSGKLTEPPPLGTTDKKGYPVLANAPGTYVLQR